MRFKKNVFILGAGGVVPSIIFALNKTANGTASWAPIIIGEINEEYFKDKFIKTYTITPIEIENKTNDFICLNYANGDMVGHTGSFEAAVKACETIDKCVKKVITSCIKTEYTVLLISDHGNCDMMLNEDGSPNTAHTKNLVPLILINSEYKSISDGILADIAPTILKIMNIEIPSEMTQNPLV